MKNENGITVRKITIIGITAAIYVALTVGLSFLSYGEIQCRIAEVMNLLVFFNPIFAPGVVLGCFISNLFSPINIPLDITLGTFSTVCAVYLISKSKNLLVASIYPTIFSGLIVGFELFITFGPHTPLSYIIYAGQVMIGQFIALTVIGYPLFRLLMKKNQNFIDSLKNITKNSIDKEN